MNHNLRRRRMRSGSVTIADVVTYFGARTLAGAGGMAVSGTAFASGNGDGHWQIASGRVTPSSAGVTAGLDQGPYVLVTDTGQTVTISITANTFSVNSEIEIRDALLACSGGETVQIRNMGFAIPTTPLNLADDMSYASQVTLTSDPGAIVENLQFKSVVNLTISGLNIHETSGSPSQSALGLLGACENVVVEECDIHGRYRDPFGDYSDGSYSNTLYGINCGFAAGSEPLSLTIRRNRIYNCRQGAIFIVQGAGGLSVTDNEFFHLYTDGFQFAARDGAKDAPLRIERNHLRAFIGLGSDVGDPHVDAIQISSGETITYSDVQIRQNVVKSDVTESRAPAMQGITLFNASHTVTLKDPIVAGNVILTGGTNALVMSALDGGVFANNTVGVSALGVADNGAGAIELGTVASSGTIYVHNNICEQLSLQGGATYDTAGNVEIGDEGAIHSYDTVFAGPSFTNPISFSQIKSRYAMLPGGPADLGGQNAGALGSGYGTYGNVNSAAGWSYDPAYESFTPTVAPPPSTPTHWWDFTDADQRTMSGTEVVELADKQGTGADLLFASGNRPTLVMDRVALFDGGAQGTFAGNVAIDHRAHTILFFGHMTSNNSVSYGWLSATSSFFVYGQNNDAPAKGYYYSSGNNAGSTVELPRYQFSNPYNESGLFGAVAYYGIGDAASATLGNGEAVDSLPALAAQSSTGTYYGSWINGDSSQNMQGRVLGTMVFDRALSTAEVDALLDWARGHYGSYHAATQDRVIICDGDSLTTGYGTANPTLNSWPAQLGTSYNLGGTKISNRALNGWAINDDPTAARTTASLTQHSGFSERVVVFWGGTNDIFSDSNPAATVIANIDAWIASVRAHDAGATLIGCTIIDRGSDDPDRATVNAHIRTVADFDAVVDLAADARLSDAADQAFFNGDAVHLTTEGYAVVAELVAAVI